MDPNYIAEIDNKKMYHWIEDSTVTNCYNCHTLFGFFLRKHHCRLCGRIYCHNCSNKTMDIPEELTIKPGKEFQIINIYSYVNNYYIGKNVNLKKGKNMVRICEECYGKIYEANKLSTLIVIFDMINFRIDELFTLRCVCKDWKKVSDYYISKIRDIRNYLPDHKYISFDRKILWNNRNQIINHNQMLIHLVRSVDNIDGKKVREKMEMIIEIMKKKVKGERRLACDQLGCGKICSKMLSPEDCLNLLNKYTKSIIIRRFAIKNLSNADITELTCYVPYFINNMKYEDIDNSVIGDYFIEICKKYSQPINGQVDGNKIIFINEFYWQLQLGLEDSKYSMIYNYFVDKLCENINKNILGLIRSGHNIITLLKNIPDGVTENEIKLYIGNNITRFNKFSLPTNPIINHMEIDISNIHIKKSKTRPIMLPFKYKFRSEVYQDYNILYKKEDVRKDKIMINIIKLIDIILKREENMDLNILTYIVRPIDSKSGLIEFVENSDTIYHIREKMKFTILNYIMENNKEEKVEEIRRRFVNSCAAYCVITYILGIGDRHLENIMITHTGILFHIDYSYILGYDTKPLTSQIRITSDMVDALGGINSIYYKEFKNKCNIIYNRLRNHLNLFINYLSLLSELDPVIDNNNREPFTYEIIKNELIKRFVPNENNKYAELLLYNHIENSSKNYSYLILDFVHYYNQENKLANSIYNSYDKAKNKFYDLYTSMF